MKNRIMIVLSCVLMIGNANAGDTIFTSPPNIRGWNTDYMYQVFLDDFDGTSLNTNVWWVEYCQSRGYKGNNEGEQNNIEVSNGTLKMTARYASGNIDNNCWDNSHFVSDYTTAEMSSRWDKYKYGCFEARCFMPRGDHFYYAYWLWGAGETGTPMTVSHLKLISLKAVSGAIIRTTR